MRVPIACVAAVLVSGILQPIRAEQPLTRDDREACSELTEIKQLMEKLASRIEELEQNLADASADQPKPGLPPAAPVFAKTYRVIDLVTPGASVARSPAAGVARTPWANFDPLVRYITTRIAPQQWEGAGGSGAVRVYQQNLSIVVVQTAEVHAEIAQWLEKIREAKAVIRDYEQGPGAADESEPQTSVGFGDSDSGSLAVELYNVADIVPQIRGDFAVAYDVDRLVRYLTTYVAPQQWSGAGGRGTIQAHNGHRELLVKQSVDVHAELALRLERLREAQAALSQLNSHP